MNLIKLGGSIITDKGRLYSLRGQELDRLAREIAEAVQAEMRKGRSREGPGAIIVHGAGSFGHVLAKRHDLAAGYKGQGQLRWVARVQRDVRMLDGCVIEALESAGIAASAIPPGAVLRRTDGAIKRFDSSIFKAYLELGIVPVTFGDVVLDTDARHRFGILSGDDLMVELARAFFPKRVIFAMDVDGVLDGPLDAGGKVVPIVSRVGDVQSTVSNGGGPMVADVTRGISGKVARALEISKALGTRGSVMLINGGAEGRLRDAMMGKAVIGTRIIAPTKAKAKGRKREQKRGA